MRLPWLKALAGGAKSRAEIVVAIGYRTLTGNLKKALDRLNDLGMIALAIPNKPNSRLQKRAITPQGKRALLLRHEELY